MRRTLVWVGLIGLALVAMTAAAYPQAKTAGLRLGAPFKVNRTMFQGYYDGHKDTYLTTDVSDKAQAAAMQINYSPLLKSVPLAAAPEMYFVQGRAAAGQLAIFGSEPGEPTYSPIWTETILTWKPHAKLTLVKSDTQVDMLESKGSLSERETSIRINSPIVKVAKGA